MNEISRRILFVDDDANLLNGLRRRLGRRYELFTADRVKDAWGLLQDEGPFAAVFSDYNMPEMNGVDFLNRVREFSPETVRVMLTGRAVLDVAVSALNEGGIFRFLDKPCPAEAIERVMLDCLEQYRLIISERVLAADLNVKNQQLQQLNEDLEARVAERTASIRRLYQFVTDLNGLDTLDEVARLIVQTAAEILRCRRVSLMLPDRQGEHLMIRAAMGIADEVVQSVRVPIGEAIAGRVFAHAQSIVFNDPDELADYQDRYDWEFFASVPLASALVVAPTGPVGVLNLTERLVDGPFEERDLADLRAISEASAIALQNQIRLLERNEAQDAIILALAKLAENRDPETGAHLERVQNYCRLLSETLAGQPRYAQVITPAFIENIVRTSPLHDIGKVGVPDHILLKPGRLTAEEFEQMKLHTVMGGRTIETLIEQGRAQAFLRMGMEIAYHHHERYDGGGYPDGLGGEAIPLAARLVALADVYDALTSKRVYKDAMPHAKAAAIIREEAGTHFDPDVVAAFEAREEEFQHLAEELGDDCMGSDLIPGGEESVSVPPEASLVASGVGDA